jgi:dephospho-CoA kinase
MGIKVIGITGGIGSGKSSVAKIIAELGHYVIETDALAKKIMTEEPEVKKKIIETFSENAYLPNGNLNAEYLSNIVYNQEDKDYKALTKLDQIVHPPVIDKMMEIIEELEKEGVEKVFVESALIYEAGLDDGFDFIIVVDCPKNKVIERLKAKYKINEEAIQLRMDSQLSSSEKVALADFVIDNSGSFYELREAVNFILKII